MLPISKIVIPARWTDTHPDCGDDGQRQGKAVFQLGMGPCGKVVERLAITFGEQFIEVAQYCVDSEFKFFYYRIADLIGRVEIEHYGA